MLKILHARLQHYVNQELSDVRAGLRKGRAARDQTANICWIIQKAREFQKKHVPVSLILLKPLTVRTIPNCGKLLKKWKYKIVYLSPEKPVCGSRNNS